MRKTHKIVHRKTHESKNNLVTFITLSATFILTWCEENIFSKLIAKWSFLSLKLILYCKYIKQVDIWFESYSMKWIIKLLSFFPLVGWSNSEAPFAIYLHHSLPKTKGKCSLQLSCNVKLKKKKKGWSVVSVEAGTGISGLCKWGDTPCGCLPVWECPLLHVNLCLFERESGLVSP